MAARNHLSTSLSSKAESINIATNEQHQSSCNDGSGNQTGSVSSDHDIPSDGASRCTSSLTPRSTSPSPYNIVPSIFMFMMSVSIAIVPLQQWLLLYICNMTESDQFPLNQSAGALSSGKMNSAVFSQTLPGLFRSVNETFEFHSGRSWESCRSHPGIQATTARWNMVLNLCTSIPALFTSPIIGIMSDQWGRKPMLYIPVICTIIGMSALLIVSWLHLGLWFLIVTHLIQGLMGSWPVMLTGTLAYIADTTDPASRSSVFVFVEAMIFCAFALGPALGGYLSRLWNENGENVFVISVISLILVLFYIILFLPESLHSSRSKGIHGDVPNNDVEESQSDRISVKVQKAFSNCFTLFKAASNTSVILLLFAVMASTASFAGRSQNFYYAAFKFGWDAMDEGQFMLTGSLSRMFHMLVMFPLLGRIFTPTTSSNPQTTQLQKVRFELNVIRAGMVCSAIGTTAMALAEQPWIWYASTAIDGFGMLSSPTVRSVLSKCIPDTHQGQLLASIQFVEQAVSLVFGIIFPVIWSKTVSTSIPNLFLWIVVILYGGAFLAVMFAQETQLNVVRDKKEDVVPSPALDPESLPAIPNQDEFDGVQDTETTGLLASSSFESFSQVKTRSKYTLTTYGSNEHLDLVSSCDPKGKGHSESRSRSCSDDTI